MILHIMTDQELNKFHVAEDPGRHGGAVFLTIPDQILHLLKSICLTMRCLAMPERHSFRILLKIRALQALRLKCGFKTPD
jgi:hypothetical protein